MNAISDILAYPCRPIRFGEVGVSVEERADGVLIVAAKAPLVAYDQNLLRRFWQHADEQPERSWVAEREAGGWKQLTYAQARRDISAVSIWLRKQNLPEGRSILVLSENSTIHAAWMFGAIAAGIPISAVSANYSLLSADYERLRHVVDLVKPAVILAERASFAPAALAVAPEDALIVSAEPAAFKGRAIAVADIFANPDIETVRGWIDLLDTSAPARYLLTSGSTGRPKAVIHTQNVMTGNSVSGAQAMGDAFDWGGVMLDWLPWSHIAGSSVLTNMTYMGGSLYIDDGRPTADRFAATIRNLRELPVSFYGTMPSGYAMLADALEQDDAFRDSFFKNLRVMLFGGAGLPQPLHDRLQRLAIEATGQRFLFVSGYGSTETASGISYTWWETAKVGIGLPVPGASFKLVPFQGVYEVRVKAPSVTPGYFGDPERAATAFDEEGYLRMEDLADFHDRTHPEQGMYFAGRKVEQFKLANGTFVAGGRLRDAVLRACPGVFRDVLICGENQTQLGVLAWPDLEAMRRATDSTELNAATRQKLHALIQPGIAAHNAANPGQSERLPRLLLLAEAPNAEAHEVSDKGSINRNIVLRRRADDVKRLFADQPDESVLRI